MLTYDLHQRGGVPLYEYLYRCIRDDILAGTLRSGERLPSKRTLAQHLGVGLITVTSAYEQLLTEGYICSAERRGYYVENLTHFVRKAPAQLDLDAPEPAEREYFMDFKANRISLKKFPASIWSRYMREALSLQQDTLLRPVPYNGLYELRLAIARYLQRSRGMQVLPSQIIIGAGTEYLYGRLLQLFGREYIFAMESPGYKKIARISAGYGNRWEHIPIDDSGLIVDRLEDSGADIVHVSPANHFPTGIVMSITRRIELFEWANRIKKRYIIEDDYDSEFRYSGKPIPPLYAEDTRSKVIYMNTFSKSLVPSLRISYMVLPPQLLALYEKTQSFYACTVSSFEQYALARFLSEGNFERHINRMKNYYRSVRAQILETLRASPLAAISVITEHNAGTHFLLSVDTELTNEQVREAASRLDLLLSFYSEYSLSEAGPKHCTLVINYAGMQPARIPEIVRRLCLIFGCG